MTDSHTEIRFYHLEKSTLEQALPSFLSKALEKGHRIVVKTPSDRDAESLSEYLWTYHPNSFLPHGTSKDGYSEDQPVYLTASEENPNKADVLVLTGGVDTEMIESFSLCCNMINGRNDQDVQKARNLWKDLKEKPFSLTYWQQGEKGWEKRSD